MTGTSAKPRFIKPPNRLKAKVGVGGIDERLLDKAQHFIQHVDVDFKPTAEQLLGNIQDLLKQYQTASSDDDKITIKSKIADSIMQIKANGGMFGYQLLGEIAALGLHFLDSVEGFNKDAHQVVDVHAKTLHIIIANKLKGDGGKEGFALVKELEKACNRYYQKYNGQ